MKIKEGLDICSMNGFWYDLVEGYLNPDEICRNKKDAIKIKKAIAIIQDFENSCEEQIPNFIQ